MTDQKIIPFKHKATPIIDETTIDDTLINDTDIPATSNRLNQLKASLDKRLAIKHEHEKELETRRLAHESQRQRTTRKLVTGLFTALLLGGMSSAGWVLANKANGLMQKDKEKISSEYATLKNRNQTLERENASLLTKLNISESNAKTLDSLSTDLSKAVDHLKTNRAELIVKLDQSNATIEQLHNDIKTQSAAFKTLSETHQSLTQKSIALNKKMSLLKSIFDQGRNVLTLPKTNPSLASVKK